MKFMYRVLVLLILAGSAQAQSSFNDLGPLLNTVQPDSIKRHIQILADDSMKGRQAGTAGYQMAVDYIISKYKQLGLAPAGENNTYLQTVKIRKTMLDPNHMYMSLAESGKELVSGEDYVLFPHFEEKNIEVNAPLIFAGYGISAPEVGYDDYKGIDVKGKIVVVVSGFPEGFASTIKSHTTGIPTIIQTAIQKGAVGVLIRSMNSMGFKNAIYNLTRNGIHTALNKEQKMFYPSYSGGAGMGLNVYGIISDKIFSELIKLSDEDRTKMLSGLKSGKPGSFAISSGVSIKYSSIHQDINSYNVVGLIKGTDQKLKDEYVVHSAHLDHVGIGTPIKGDSIYNGAHDNASGVSCSLEIARLYSGLPGKTKRSILFVMVTSEELGLLGSSYFATYPTVPKNKIVADVNTDMPTIIAPFLSAVPLGALHSSLFEKVKLASAYLGIEVQDDPEPEQNRFVRSDQYSFVRQGIPALHIKYGEKMTDPNKKLSDEVKKWRSEFYHLPPDELSKAPFDFEAGKKFVQLNFLIGYQVAQDKNRPTWNKGDFFGERFGKK